MAVDRADVIEAEFLEQSAAHGHTAGEFLGAGGAFLDEFRQPLGKLLGGFAQAQIGPPGNPAGQIGAHGADRRGDRHVVVVEDDDQPGVHAAGIVHGLIGHAGGHGAIADDADDVVVAAAEIAGHSHAEAGGNRGRGVAGAKGVVFALGALGEAGQAAALAQGADAIAPAGEDLVGVALVADVPDQPVARRVEHIMQRHR